MVRTIIPLSRPASYVLNQRVILDSGAERQCSLSWHSIGLPNQATSTENRDGRDERDHKFAHFPFLPWALEPPAYTIVFPRRSTRYLGIGFDDALAIAEQIDV